MSFKKDAKLFIQLGDFINYDMYQRGFYSIQCRIFSRDPKSLKRLDAIPIFLVGEEEDLTEFTQHRTKCYLDHRLCSWKCKVANTNLSVHSLMEDSPSTIDTDATLYVSATFEISEQYQKRALYQGIVFRLEIPELGSSETTFIDDFFDCFLEFSLAFSVSSKESLLPVQTKLVQLKNVFADTKSKPILHQYHSIQFDGIYFSTLDCIITFCIVGYKIPKREAPPNPNPKSLINWIGKKFLAFFIPEKKYIKPTIELSSLDYQRLEASLSYLINISEMTRSSQAESMSLQYLYDALYKRLYETENIISIKSQPISPSIRKDCVILLKELLKNWLAMCQDPEKATIGIEKVLDELFLQSRKLWRLYLSMNGVLGEEKVGQLRNLWTRIKYARMSEAILPLSAQLLPIPSVLNKLRKVHSFKFPYDRIRETTLKYFLFEHQHHSQLEMSISSNTEPSHQRSGSMNAILGSIKSFIMESRQESVKSFELPIESNQSNYLARIEELSRLSGSIHLIVFVHGLLGTSFDFRHYRNRLMKASHQMGLNENFIYLISESNEANTLDGIQEQGKNLATEITQYIHYHQIKVEKTSFICHSLGGLIARAALPFLHDLTLYSFVSYGTPHGSLICHQHALINSFLGIYQSLQKSKCIEQLYLKDATDPKKCYLYRLAHDESLGKFKIIRLFGSPILDKYVPFASTLVLSESKHSVYDSLIEILQRQMNQATVEKFEIHSDQPKDFLGRKGHVAMVEDEALIDLFLLANKFHL